MWMFKLNKWNEKEEEKFLETIGKIDENFSLHDATLELEKELKKDYVTLLHHYCYIVDRLNLELEHYKSKHEFVKLFSELPEDEREYYTNTLTDYWI